MALNREEIVEAAFSMLREGGLGGLSMRRLADELGVHAGALYYHVANKQELLVAVAGRILGGDAANATEDPRRAAADLRRALLRVRDGAEVVSFALAFRPDSLTPLAGLHRLFDDRLEPQKAEWAAQTLVHYVLGYVADEQNRLELVRAEILPAGAAPVSPDRFLFGVDLILRGLDSEAVAP